MSECVTVTDTHLHKGRTIVTHAKTRLGTKITYARRATEGDLEAIRENLSEYKRMPESYGLELRLNLAEIVLAYLKRTGVTQYQLANRAGMDSGRLNQVIHANANCTLDVVGRLLHAMDLKGRLVVVDGSPSVEEPSEMEYQRMKRGK